MLVVEAVLESQLRPGDVLAWRTTTLVEVAKQEFQLHPEDLRAWTMGTWAEVAKRELHCPVVL